MMLCILNIFLNKKIGSLSSWVCCCRIVAENQAWNSEQRLISHQCEVHDQSELILLDGFISAKKTPSVNYYISLCFFNQIVIIIIW